MDASTQSNGHRSRPPRQDRPSQRPTDGRPPTSRERPERSDRRQKEQLDIFADPPGGSKTANNAAPPRDKSQRRSQRRNSESSVVDRKVMDAEGEKARRERRAKDERHKDGRTRSKKPNQRLDIIDKLDVTSIYGTGSKCFAFHIPQRFAENSRNLTPHYQCFIMMDLLMLVILIGIVRGFVRHQCRLSPRILLIWRWEVPAR